MPATTRDAMISALAQAYGTDTRIWRAMDQASLQLASIVALRWWKP